MILSMDPSSHDRQAIQQSHGDVAWTCQHVALDAHRAPRRSDKGTCRRTGEAVTQVCQLASTRTPRSRCATGTK
jgi:hypothetical protein